MRFARTRHVRSLGLLLVVATAVGCSLIVQPADSVQCASNQDCVRFAGSVCREQFCVPGENETVPDASTLDASTVDAQTDAPGSDPLSPRQGDVVVLLPGAFEYAADAAHVTAWRNAVPGATLRAEVTGEGEAAQPAAFTRSGNTCLGFDEYQRMVLQDEGGLRPDGDFSVLAVVGTPALENGEYSSGGRIPVARMNVDHVDSETFQATGWALKTAWQHDEAQNNQDRFAASVVTIGGTISPQNAKDVVDPSGHDTNLHVLGLSVRSQQLHLWVDGIEKGSPLGTVVTQPQQAPLTLGSIAAPPYQWAAFTGYVCTVIVHHGAESDAELAKRFGALKMQFQTP